MIKFRTFFLTVGESYFSSSQRIFLRLIFLLLITGSSLKAKAENDSLKLVNNLRITLAADHGAVYPHHSSIRYDLNSNLSGMELGLTTDTYGKSVYDRLWRFPRYGVGYLFTGLGNSEIYGKAHAAFLYIDIPFSLEEKAFRSSYQICAGMAYLTECFDVVENPLNMAISTRLNIYVSFRLNAGFAISKQSELFMGLSLSHFSNGKFGTPNFGINTGAVKIGYRYNLLPARFSRLNSPDLPFFRLHTVELFLSGGAKTDDQLSGKLYPVSTFAGEYKYAFCRRYAAGLGIDLFYDAALGPNKEAMGDERSTTADLFQMGIHFALYSRVNRLHVFGNLGMYTIADFYKYSRFYARIGFRYDITDKIMLSLAIKSHYAIADYLEWGVGYRFSLNGNYE